ncbi:SDR family NAD(P)-dependent oxidoreductase [Marinilabilia rubra]|nr:SDR family NAD(P)-dependent oxidoreductase [Marinilabilia rubra]
MIDWTNIVPAIRMLASRSSLLTCRTFIKTEKNSFEGIDDLKELNESIDENSILELSASDLDHPSLVKAFEYWFKTNEKAPSAVWIKGEGVIAIENVAKESEPESFDRRIANRIVLVTGGAQGFGGGIAEELYQKGAHVVIADMNAEAGNMMVSGLKAKKQSNKAFFVEVNVSDPASVERMVEKIVLESGGLDVLISNAGILRAGGLDEMEPETFELMTKVNYMGYFYCAKYASKIMKIQSSVDNGHFMDLIQINSKSGLKGSNKNFAYAGGKFGGIGLTQSFALELMPNNIKVNSICPGNFFDGPLWSDPEKGLFVQYLKAGKVPGAKSVADVKAHYENQVPAGRGCQVSDLVKAVLYVVEQEYETGQAVPVTGGQEMLK